MTPWWRRSPGTGWVRNWVVGPGLPGLLLHLTLNRKQTKCLYVHSYSFKQWRLSSGLKLQICMVTLMLSEHIWKAGGILPLFPYSFISTSSGTKSCFSFALFCFDWLNSVWTKYDWQILVLRAQVPGTLSITWRGKLNMPWMIFWQLRQFTLIFYNFLNLQGARTQTIYQKCSPNCFVSFTGTYMQKWLHCLSSKECLSL